MRERVIIGVIASLVIGVAVYVASQPDEGTLEWHQQEYLRALEHLQGRTVRARLDRFYIKLRKSRDYRFLKGAAADLQKHELALIRLGFLEAKTIRTGGALGARVRSILDEGTACIPEGRLAFVQLSGSGSLFPPASAPISAGVSRIGLVRIVAPREDMAVWEELIRKADEESLPVRVFEEKELTNDSLRLKAAGKVPELNEMMRKPEVWDY